MFITLLLLHFYIYYFFIFYDFIINYRAGREKWSTENVLFFRFKLQSHKPIKDLGIPLEFSIPSEMDFIWSCLTFTDPGTPILVALILSRVKHNCKGRGYFIIRTNDSVISEAASANQPVKTCQQLSKKLQPVDAEALATNATEEWQIKPCGVC